MTDKEFVVSDELTTQPAPERSRVTPASLIAPPAGHEWRLVSEGDPEPGVFGLYIGVIGGGDYWFRAEPAPVWPTEPGEYTMRRADGHEVTALLNSSGGWSWLDGRGVLESAWPDVDVRDRRLLSLPGAVS